MNKIYKDARLKKGLTLEQSAELMHCTARTVWAHENEKNPDAYYVSQMAKIYGKPELTQFYCKNNCPIGRDFSYELLDNVDLNITTILSKLNIEMKEAQGVMNDLISKSINHEFENNMESFTDDLQELLDVEHNIEILKIKLHQWLDVKEITNIHNEKCIAKNYTKKKNTPCKAH